MHPKVTYHASPYENGMSTTVHRYVGGRGCFAKDDLLSLDDVVYGRPFIFRVSPLLVEISPPSAIMYGKTDTNTLSDEPLKFHRFDSYQTIQN